MREFVTDEEGHRAKVILDIEEYERLLDLVEDAEDAREHERVVDDIRAGREERIPWEESKRRRRAGR